MPPKLKSLKINQFRWVKPGSELRFDDGLNFVLGKNGTGKTTLLDLIGAVWTGDFSAYAGEEVDLEFEFQLRLDRTLRVHITNRATTVEPDLGLAFTLDASLQTGNVAHGVSVAHSQPALFYGPNLEERTALPHLPSADELSFLLAPFKPEIGRHPERVHALWETLLYQLRARAGLDIEYTATNGWHSTGPSLSAPDVGPLSKLVGVRFGEDDHWAREVIAGLWIGGRTMPNRDVPSNTWHLPALPTDIRQMFIDAVSQSSTLGQSIELVGHASGPGPLSQVVLALDVESVVLRLDLELGEIDRGTRGGRAFAYTNPTIRITKKDGSSFLFDKLSHGQKRLFGLYWYLAASPQVFIADELSNGLHYTMVERILKEEIGKRQCFLALQDPLLLYNATFDDLDHVKRRFVICELSEEGGLEWWTWRQLRDDEATEFFEGYQAGIEHVPDILRSRGLW